ncbi:MAG TPA: hypothetical protein V6C85_28595 [Allocoleopsis sp.]
MVSSNRFLLQVFTIFRRQGLKDSPYTGWQVNSSPAANFDATPDRCTA